MKEYLLFIDTETSGLPKKWNKPYSDNKNWPFSIQIAWIIFSKDGKEIKKDNFYIRENDFTIDPSSLKTHGITKDFLKENGERRKKVMSKLAYDIKKYKPMLVGHFMELDYHVLGADFFRSGMENPMKELPLFCTMLASDIFVKNPQSKFLRLSQLYDYLFNKKATNIHNALTDATITADCFFEMLKRGHISDELIMSQQSKFQPKQISTTGLAWAWVFFISLLIVIIFLAYEF